ncbi:MAG: hypothetical protein AB1736_05565 [Chloroflexota bacterium]
MSAPRRGGAAIRRGGRIVGPDGRVTTWSMAEGTRGRRWRWSMSDRRGLVEVHTVELNPDGRFARLESATAAGLLTLHREPDGSLHGNRVGERGVDHLTFAAPAPEVVVVGSGPLAVAIASAGSPAEAAAAGCLAVSDDLDVSAVAVSVRRSTGGDVELRIGRGELRATLDADGLPVDGAGSSTSWGLERD